MQRVVAILEGVARAGRPTTPARVSEETELSLSTVSRIMRELAEERLLERDADGTYVLGARMFDLVSSAAVVGDRTSAINRTLQDLRDLTGETASLHVRRGDQRVCIASAISRHELRRVITIGDSANLVGTVPGDVLLSEVPESEQVALVSAVLSGRTRTAQLEKVKFAAEQGFSAYAAEGLGLAGIAVPVRNGGVIRSALTLSGPVARFTVETAQAWLPDLHSAAKRLEPWFESD